MHSFGINGKGELKGQAANPGSPGKWPLKWSVCLCMCPFKKVVVNKHSCAYSCWSRRHWRPSRLPFQGLAFRGRWPVTRSLLKLCVFVCPCRHATRCRAEQICGADQNGDNLRINRAYIRISDYCSIMVMTSPSSTSPGIAQTTVEGLADN